MRVVEAVAAVEDIDASVSRLGRAGEKHGATVQALDAQYVVDREHVARAVELADRAIERGEAIARDRAVEILLYAAGRRQINRALEMGLSEGEQPVVVVIDGGDEAGAADAVRGMLEPAETLGEFDPGRVREFFGVEKAELAVTSGSLADLVRERVALLTVER